jgi:catechol 2,3-dioxygenase-like lactoylglutathione lyase family enzyme
MSLSHANPVTFIATRDRAKAKEFYGDVLGLSLLSEDYFAAVFDLNGIALRIATVPDHVAAQQTVLGWDVANIEDMVTSLAAKGVTFATFPGLKQDELGIWQAPGSAKVAWFHDPDGNGLSLTQF